MIRPILLALALAAGVSSAVQAQAAQVVAGCGQQGNKLGDAASTTADTSGNLCVNSQPFRPASGATVTLTVGPTATPAGALPVATAGTFPVGSVTAYRVRNATASASPVTLTLTPSNTATATLGTAFTTAGTGGTRGDKTIDPNSTEYFGLTAAQQTALAAGTLYISAVTPAGGSATITITPGNGS